MTTVVPRAGGTRGGRARGPGGGGRGRGRGRGRGANVFAIVFVVVREMFVVVRGAVVVDREAVDGGGEALPRTGVGARGLRGVRRGLFERAREVVRRGGHDRGGRSSPPRERVIGALGVRREIRRELLHVRAEPREARRRRRDVRRRERELAVVRRRRRGGPPRRRARARARGVRRRLIQRSLLELRLLEQRANLLHEARLRSREPVLAQKREDVLQRPEVLGRHRGRSDPDARPGERAPAGVTTSVRTPSSTKNVFDAATAPRI